MHERLFANLYERVIFWRVLDACNLHDIEDRSFIFSQNAQLLAQIVVHVRNAVLCIACAFERAIEIPEIFNAYLQSPHF